VGHTFARRSFKGVLIDSDQVTGKGDHVPFFKANLVLFGFNEMRSLARQKLLKGLSSRPCASNPDPTLESVCKEAALKNLSCMPDYHWTALTPLVDGHLTGISLCSL
jgi:hypothetical protein